jgi:hypothetical protein
LSDQPADSITRLTLSPTRHAALVVDRYDLGLGTDAGVNGDGCGKADLVVVV